MKSWLDYRLSGFAFTPATIKPQQFLLKISAANGALRLRTLSVFADSDNAN
jgi:hypothetical protein